MSVAILSRMGARDHLVISDVNSGLYVVEAPWPAERRAARRR